jgi:hypothetical protein
MEQHQDIKAADYSPDVDRVEATSPDGPKGLGGWLILVGLGVVLAPLMQIKSVYEWYWVPLRDGQFFAWINPSSPDFVPYAKTLIITETVVNNLLILGSLWLVYLFFRKRRLFPTVYIALMIASIVVMVVDPLVVKQVFSLAEAFDKESIRDLTKMIVSSLIWIPYMLLSSRVKNTFVE